MNRFVFRAPSLESKAVTACRFGTLEPVPARLVASQVRALGYSGV